MEVGGLEALLVVELGARGAQRVVEGVHAPVLGLADVAGPRLLDLARRSASGAPAPSIRGGGTKTSVSRAARIPVPARSGAVVRLGPALLGRAQRPHQPPLLRRGRGGPCARRPPAAASAPRPAAAPAASGRRPRPRAPPGRGAAPPARAPRAPGPRGGTGRERARGRSPVLGHPPSLRGFRTYARRQRLPCRARRATSAQTPVEGAIRGSPRSWPFSPSCWTFCVVL